MWERLTPQPLGEIQLHVIKSGAQVGSGLSVGEMSHMWQALGPARTALEILALTTVAGIGPSWLPSLGAPALQARLPERFFPHLLSLPPMTSPPFPLYLGKMRHPQELLYLESSSTAPACGRDPSEAVIQTITLHRAVWVTCPKQSYAYLPHSRSYTSVNVTLVPRNFFGDYLLQAVLEPFL